MNNFNKIKNHLKNNGYKFNNSNIGTHDIYGPVLLDPVGEDAHLGVRLSKFYPININNQTYADKIELYKLVNKANRTLIGGTVYFDNSDFEFGMGLSFLYLGEYDKNYFNKTLDIYHLDTNKMYDFDFKPYIAWFENIIL